MSTHPNAILKLTLKPDDLARKTYREVLGERGVTASDDRIKIGENDYNILVLEDGWHDDWQIGGDEGDIIVFAMVTYGYGTTILWDKLEAQKNALEAWAKTICEYFKCTSKIEVTANYW